MICRPSGAITNFQLLLLAVFPLGDVLLRPIEGQYLANPEMTQVDGIILLGGGEDARASAFWQQMQLNEVGERYLAAISLAQRYPQAKLLFTGGSGALRDLGGIRVTEASWAEQVFLAHGIAKTRLLLEGASRNTAENARLSLALAQPKPGQRWVLVTSAFHMPRAMRSFEAAGWGGVIAYPVDHRSKAISDGIGWNLSRNLDVLNTAIRERIGQLAYRLSGR
jgi:uncharacterized SAM-binding protein YcdF (DUF218 family)